METITQYISGPLHTVRLLLLAIVVILHVVFAAAVARDAGRFEKTAGPTALVSGVTWAFATLVGGVMVAAVYWFIHHSTLTHVNK